jgi:hypothetical protein
MKVKDVLNLKYEEYRSERKSPSWASFGGGLLLWVIITCIFNLIIRCGDKALTGFRFLDL